MKLGLAGCNEINEYSDNVYQQNCSLKSFILIKASNSAQV
jgi:hypothetical protein